LLDILNNDFFYFLLFQQYSKQCGMHGSPQVVQKGQCGNVISACALPHLSRISSSWVAVK